MNESPIQHLRVWLRGQVPLLVAVLLLLLTAVPTRIPGWQEVTPMLPLVPVCFWAVYRPDLLGNFAVFALGVLADLVMGTPLGVQALVYLLARGAVAGQRRFFLAKPLPALWLGFALIAVLASLLAWMLMAWVDGGLAPLAPVLVSAGLLVALFPLLAALCARLTVRVLHADT